MQPLPPATCDVAAKAALQGFCSMPKPLPAEARPGSAYCHVATVSHDSSSISAMRCVRPPLKLYSTAAAAAVTLVCAGTLQVYSTWCRAYTGQL